MKMGVVECVRVPPVTTAIVAGPALSTVGMSGCDIWILKLRVCVRLVSLW